MLLNTVPYFVCMCVCVCVLLLTVFSSCVSLSTRLKQFLLFTLNDHLIGLVSVKQGNSIEVSAHSV